MWATVLAVLAFIVAPLAVVVASSFTATGYLAFPPEGFSLEWYGAAARNSTFVDSFLTSLQLALAVAAICALVSIPASYAIARHPGRTATLLEQVFLSPLMLPAVVFGLGLLFVLSALGYRGTFVGGLLGHVIIASPFVIRSVLAGFRDMDPHLEDAAMSLGASRLRAFLTVTLPSVLGSAMSGLVFAFVISFDEAVVTLFLTGPSFETLPVTIFTYVQYSNDPTIAAVSTVLIAISFVLVALTMRSPKDSDDR
ncbi:ABC transporter permease [Ornithinimicrobium cavernae]|uniref:ABC transporter permease n=1 Tax=Ornithinimicrobium cavernae TaxID=2666047 RepID=UPI000D68F77A|nr:ABC transporter permease [Ornithinimicrobium cavernae]